MKSLFRRERKMRLSDLGFISVILILLLSIIVSIGIPVAALVLLIWAIFEFVI